MDTGRVGACHRLENKRRKYLMVVNDVVKNRYDVVAEYLDHAHDESANNFEKSKAFVRRALVRQKVLQKCMKMRRQNMDHSSIYGRYGGKPVEAFSRDIESYITYNHPKKRRKRYLQTLMSESLEKGAILKETVTHTRVQSWLERSYTKYKLMKAKREQSTLEPIPEADVKPVRKRQSGSQLRLPPVMRSSLAVQEETETETDANTNVLKISEEIEHLDLNAKPETDEKPEPEIFVSKPEVHLPAKTLKLPPITSTRSMVAT